MTNKPDLPVPAPLRGTDAGTFTEYTIKQRFPNIARRVLTENKLTAVAVARMEALLAEIPYGEIRPLTDTHAPDFTQWQNWIAPYAGQNWLQPPWFFAETCFYRRIIEAVDYFATGFDPFTYQKEQGLERHSEAIFALCQQLARSLVNGWQPSQFSHWLLADLWGNQVDLSMWSVDDASKPSHSSDAVRLAHTLVDDRAAVLALLNKLENIRVDFIVDNAGLELVSDLVLADYLLTTGKAGTIHFHVKLHPTFVSDATTHDVLQTLVYLNGRPQSNIQALADRLTGYMVDGRFHPVTHPFWTSPLPLWQMPDELRQESAPAHLIISKGDANYRRALGDAHWPTDTPFQQIVSYLPAPALFLRTCKSEVIAGLPPGQAEALTEQEPDWLVNGKWGLIQFTHP
ncbi:MAG TPA: protein-glutamate O-methyltransferase family protein [Anaerolineae bacterium]|nr:protein-glutamate O-methyltransferase family protein [Anaerolineae bacterium]